MTVDPASISDRSRFIDQSELQLPKRRDDREEMATVAEVGDGVKDLLD